MRELTAPELAPRRHRAPLWEMGARYCAAYGCMLVALGASWQSLQSPFAPILAFVLCIGLPLSLWLRANHLQWGGHPINRLALSSVVMALTLLISAAFLITNLASFGWTPASWIRALTVFSVNRSIELMLGVFLILGICRCLFILTDKDALWCAVPSFAVLLLIMLVQREPSAVLSFMVWAVLTATLLALDHRRESRHGLSGFVASVVPGQDVKLSARSLATIISVSLSCSIALSYTLAVTESDSRGAFEQFLRVVTGGLGRFSSEVNSDSLTSPDTTSQSLIDFRSGPPLPTRVVLWRLEAWHTKIPRNNSDDRGTSEREFERIFPTYWRLSSLSRYDGASWTIPAGFSSLRLLTRSTQESRFGTVFDVSTRRQNVLRGNKLIAQTVTAVVPTSGFIPSLPNPLLVARSRQQNNGVRANPQDDISIDSVKKNESIVLQSQVALQAYGNADSVPSRTRSVGNPELVLSGAEKRINLQLPPITPARVRQLALRLTRETRSNADSYERAVRIAQWVQNIGTYTLRPPNLPEDRDATDFFLFESRRGFCTHFAGALAVLCRAAGIPSRVVTGFANLEQEVSSSYGGAYQLARSANAHAWTEIWQDGVGWIPLDATPPDDRGDNAPTIWQDVSDRVGSALANLWISVQLNRNLWIGGVALVVMLMLTALGVNRRVRERNRAWALARKVWSQRLRGAKQTGAVDREENAREQRDLAARAAIFTAYNKAARQLTRRFKARREGQTPHDWLQEAEAALPQVDWAPMRSLVELQRRAMYNPQYMNSADSDEARAAFKRLSWKKRPVAS